MWGVRNFGQITFKDVQNTDSTIYYKAIVAFKQVVKFYVNHQSFIWCHVTGRFTNTIVHVQYMD